MFVPLPECNELKPHDPHEFGLGLGAQNCHGWSMEQAAVEALCVSVHAWLHEKYPFWDLRPDILPAGLKLQLHPRVSHMLTRNIDLRYVRLGHNWKQHFGVPVEITPQIEGWRLATITEDVHIGGVMP